jgi:hypothetical protein
MSDVNSTDDGTAVAAGSGEPAARRRVNYLAARTEPAVIAPLEAALGADQIAVATTGQLIEVPPAHLLPIITPEGNRPMTDVALTGDLLPGAAAAAPAVSDGPLVDPER